MTDFDHHMMGIALAMARRGLGSTAPNPSVGAVIADPKTGEVLARGWTQPGGRPHAETEALRRAGGLAKGATVYVTLEPCAHVGRTPPCADALIAAGVARVVVGVEDPDPRTAGRGIKKLRAAGIEVESGVRREEAYYMTAGHIERTTHNRPFIQLKAALGHDGAAPRGTGGAPAWVTSTAARAVSHMIRAEADAILVGAGTVRDDDPQLDCRLSGMKDRSPVRIVLSRMLDLPSEAKLWNAAKSSEVWIITTTADYHPRGRDLQALGVKLIKTEPRIPIILAELADRGITRLVVEGGPQVWRAFADTGFVDEVILFVASNSSEELAREAARTHLGMTHLVLAETRTIGPDTMWRFVPRRQEPMRERRLATP